MAWRMRLLLVVLALVGVGQARAQEVLFNGTFEESLNGWFTLGDATLQRTDATAAEGDWSARATGRTQPWNGPAQFVTGRLVAGETYRVGVWVRQWSSAPETVLLTLKLVDDSGTRYLGLVIRTVEPGAWHRFETYYTHEPVGAVTEALLYVEGPPAGVDLSIDGAGMSPAPSWRERADEGVELHRKGDLTVRVVDGLGEPVPGAAVSIEQAEHEFVFGTAVNSFAIGNAPYDAFVLEHFNSVTPENSWKWQANEPQRDVLSFTGADIVASFAQSNGLRVHGHTMFWCVDQFVPAWQFGLDAQELEGEVSERIADMTGRYASVAEAWDVNNEMLHGGFYRARLGPGIRPAMFQMMRGAAPGVRLFVNDYNVVSGNETEAYVAQIEDLLAQGAPIDGIGVQAHHSNGLSPYLAQDRLDRLAELGLPIRVTEYDSVQADPAQRSADLEEFYRVAFGHPAVEGITMWGFWAGRHWRGADAAIVDLDWTVNEAGQMYQSLRQEWRTDEEGNADNAGEYTARVFHGTHDVTASAPGYESAQRSVTVSSDDAGVVVTVTLGRACATDLNGDGVQDNGDIGAFVAYFLGQDLAADFNGDSVLDNGDIGAFVSAFLAGC
ncbi:MAG: endo-1,4-beta-xylanase [Phycisphaerales bacterium JB040]